MFFFTFGDRFFGATTIITPDNISTEIAFEFLRLVHIVGNETVCVANILTLIYDQKESSVTNSCGIRNAVYVSVLTNRLTTTITTELPPALIAVDLPASQCMGAFSLGLTEPFGRYQA